MSLRQQPQKHVLVEHERNIVPVARKLGGNAGVHFAREDVQISRIALIQLHGIVRRLVWHVLEEGFKLLTTLRQERYRPNQYLLRGDDLFPVRIVARHTFCIPRPVFRFDATASIEVVTPRIEPAGFRCFCLHQCQRKRDREVIHIQRNADIQQFSAVGRCNPLPAEVDPPHDHSRLVSVHELCRLRQQRDKPLGQLADGAVFIFTGDPPLHAGHRKQSPVTNSQNAVAVFDLQHFVPAAVHRVPELIESHDAVKCALRPALRFKRDLFRLRAGREANLILSRLNSQCFEFRFRRCPANQFPQSDQSASQLISVHFKFHLSLSPFLLRV